MKGRLRRFLKHDVVYGLRRRELPIAIALAAAIVLVPAYFALTGSGGGGGDNGGGSSNEFPEEVASPRSGGPQQSNT